MEEKGRYPQDGSVQLLQAQEEVVSVLDGEEVVIVLLQNAGIKGCEVCAAAHVPAEDLSWRKVAAEDEVVGVDGGAAPAACQDSTVSHHGARVVALVKDGRRVRQEGAEVLADGEDVFMTGVVVVHQLTDTNAALGQGKVAWHVDVLGNLFTAKHTPSLTSHWITVQSGSLLT